MMKYIIVGIDESTVNKDDCLVMMVSESLASNYIVPRLGFSSVLTRHQGIKFLIDASNEAAKGIDPKAVTPVDTSPGESHLGAQQADWRVGLSVKPRLRTHPDYYESMAKVIGVFPSGHGGITDPSGVLMLQRDNKTFLAPSADWVTA